MSDYASGRRGLRGQKLRGLSGTWPRWSQCLDSQQHQLSRRSCPRDSFVTAGVNVGWQKSSRTLPWQNCGRPFFLLGARAAQWWPRCHCRKSRISEPGVHRVSSLSAKLMGNRTWSTFNSDQAKHLLYIYIYSSASVVSRCSYTKSVYWKSPPLWPTAV